MMRKSLVLGALLMAAPAAAHQNTVAHSRMTIHDNGDVQYALKIPVEDLAESLGRQGHAPLNGPEVRAAEDALFRHFMPLVGMSAGGAACPAERTGIDVPEDDRLHGELQFLFRCPAGVPVTLDYRVFFDVDEGHMGMLEVESSGGKTRAELIRERPRWEVDPSAAGPPQLRVVESTAALPTSKPVPAAEPRSPRSIVAEPAVGAEPAPKLEAQVPVELGAPASRTQRSSINWMPIAVVLLLGLVGTGAFLAQRVLRRRPSSG